MMAFAASTSSSHAKDPVGFAGVRKQIDLIVAETERMKAETARIEAANAEKLQRAEENKKVTAAAEARTAAANAATEAANAATEAANAATEAANATTAAAEAANAAANAAKTSSEARNEILLLYKTYQAALLLAKKNPNTEADFNTVWTIEASGDAPEVIGRKGPNAFNAAANLVTTLKKRAEPNVVNEVKNIKLPNGKPDIPRQLELLVVKSQPKTVALN